MFKHLTNDHRRLLGAAIAMAAADGTLTSQELGAIDEIAEKLHLSPAARDEVAQMMACPPTPSQIAEWVVTEQDKVGVYAVAVRVAAADGRWDEAEQVLLNRLAAILNMTKEQVDQAERLGRGGES